MTYEEQDSPTGQAVAIHEGQIAAPNIVPIRPTAQEMRTVEVNEALLPAYQKASTLELTDEEVAALMAPFPDDVVEIRSFDGLIFLSHIFISDRLNRVFKPGKWALIKRRDWFDQGSSTMYGEYVMLIRGCYVGESIGGHPYAPNNPKTNFSDVLESTAAEALRRIAGKRLSCGSQVWNPEYARQWVANHAAKVNGKWEKRITSPQPPRNTSTPPKAPPVVKEEAKKATTAEVLPPKEATEATREWFLSNLKQFSTEDVRSYFVAQKWILPDVETPYDVPLMFTPTSKEGLAKVVRDIETFLIKTHPDIAKVEDADILPDDIASVKIVVPRRGQKRADYIKNMDTIGSLYVAAKAGSDEDRKRLWGMAQEWSPQPYTNPTSGKTYQPSPEDHACRAGLDAFLEFEEAKKGKK